jgi:hypothetical protein
MVNNLTVDYLENVEASTSQKPMGLHGHDCTAGSERTFDCKQVDCGLQGCDMV